MAGVAAVVVVGVMAPSSASAATPAGTTCKKIYFVGSRGSGELVDDSLSPAEKRESPAAQRAKPTYGFGVRVARVHTEFLKNLPAGVSRSDVGEIYNTYTAMSAVDTLKPTVKEAAAFLNGGVSQAWAIGNYWYGEKPNDGGASFVASAELGRVQLREMLRTKATECKKAKFVLAGYSQGAMATHQALDDLIEDEVFNRIIGVFLVADGDRYATQANRYGTADPGATGVRAVFGKFIPTLQPQPSPIVQPNIVADICDKGDIVCDWSVPSLLQFDNGRTIHESYQNAGGRNQPPANTDIPRAVQGMRSQINGGFRYPVIDLRTYSLPGAIMNKQYTTPLKAVGGDGRYKFAATGLPPTFKVQGTQITGMPKSFGKWSVTITVTDGSGQRDSYTTDLVVGLK